MEKVIEMLKQRQRTKSINSFANELGIWPSTLWRYYRGERQMGAAVVKILARHFIARGDFDALATLTDYTFGGMYDDSE